MECNKNAKNATNTKRGAVGGEGYKKEGGLGRGGVEIARVFLLHFFLNNDDDLRAQGDNECEQAKREGKTRAKYAMQKG